MVERPTITIAHQLPGRVRLYLTHRLKDPTFTIRRVSKHPGILSMTYTSISRSVLVDFNPFEVTSHEIIIRLACCLSVDHGGVPIRVLAEPENKEVSDSALYSAVSLFVAITARAVIPGTRATRVLDWIGGLTVAGAVVVHGWNEVRRRGVFDPEVLSVVYLVGSIVQGRLLSGAIVTWLTTFGRHLVRPPTLGIELRMFRPEGADAKADEGCEVIVTPDRSAEATTRILRFIPELVRYALIGGTAARDGSLLGQITTLAELHGSVLEGLGEAKYGIPIKVSDI